VGDLRLGVRDRRDQRRLAGVRHAEQADVGENAQLELQSSMLAGPARSLLPRCAVGAALEVKVAETAVAALGEEHLLVVLEQLDDALAGVGVADDRADGHAQDDVGGGGTVLVGAAPVLAVPRLVPARVAEVDQRVEVAVGERPDAAAAAAVAAVRAAERDELLAPKAQAAVAAVAGSDLDGRFVDELHGRRSTSRERSSPAFGLRPPSCGRTMVIRPIAISSTGHHWRSQQTGNRSKLLARSRAPTRTRMMPLQLMTSSASECS